VIQNKSENSPQTTSIELLILYALSDLLLAFWNQCTVRSAIPSFLVLLPYCRN